VSIKQWVEPQSTKLVVGSSEAEVRETEMIRELGSDKAVALSRTFGGSPLESSQPSRGGGRGLLTLLTPQRE